MFASCLFFRVKPLLLKARAGWSDTGDVKWLPCSHRLLAGFNFDVKVLHLLCN